MQSKATKKQQLPGENSHNKHIKILTFHSFTTINVSTAREKSMHVQLCSNLLYGCQRLVFLTALVSHAEYC